MSYKIIQQTRKQINSESEHAKVSGVTDVLCKGEEDREFKKMQYLHIYVILRAFLKTGKLVYFINFEARIQEDCSNVG